GKLQSWGEQRKRSRACLRRVLRQASALAGRLRSVPGAESQIPRRLLSGVASGVGPAQPECSRRGAARVSKSNRSGTLRAIPFFPATRSPQGACPREGRELDRRSAFLCFSRFQRCLGESRIIPRG